MFLSNGMSVFAVEPNDAMRTAAERSLGDQVSFHSIKGTAEETTLPGASVDLIFCAQAFHWFDPIRAPREFRRIATSGAHVALVWNSRPAKATPFINGYEQLLQTYGIDYANVRHRGIAQDELSRIFGRIFEYHVLSNTQEFDFAGLRGRLLSSSYAPVEGHSNHAPMIAALADLFARSQREGRVTMLYDTEIYITRL